MHVNDINEGKISPGDGEKECLSVEEGVQENVEESEESSEDSDLKGAMQDELEPKEILAKKETSTVFRLKLIVMLVLLFSAVGVSTGVYFFASRQEESTFETQFTGASNKVLENIGRSIERNLDSFDSVAVTLISFTHNTNKSWPFVTLPNFAVRMSKILPLTNSAYISINPVVAPEHRKEWEQYSLENQFWINETMAFQETWKEYYGPVVYEWTPDPVIHGISGDEPYNIRYA